MKKEIADIWVKALNSKKYKQTTDYLCQIDNNGNKSFCCLGVLCDLYQQDRVEKKKKKLKVDDDDNFNYMVSFDGETKGLPSSVMKWAGIKKSDGTHCEDRYNLAEMNDNGYTFSEIAKHIKKNYEEI